MAAFICPICDEPLTSAPPNYEAETARAQELTGEPVVVLELAADARRARGRYGTSSTKAPAKGKKQREAKSSIIGTPCGHLFHDECINQWFKSANPRTCPSCRKPCVLNKMVPMFPVLGDNNQRFSDTVSPSTSRARAPLAGPLSAQRKRAKKANLANSSGTPTPTPAVEDIEVIDFDAPGPAGAPPTAGSNQVAANPNPGNFAELTQTHNLLIQDYEELQTKLNEEVDKNAMNQGIINSLETVCEEHKQELAKTKNELDVARTEIQALGGHEANVGGNGTSASPTPPKRARTSCRMSTGGAGKRKYAGAAAGSSSTDTLTVVPPPPPVAEPEPRRAAKKPRVVRNARKSKTAS